MNRALKRKKKKILSSEPHSSWRQQNWYLTFTALWQPHFGSCYLTDRNRGAEFDINRTEMLPNWARIDKTAKCKQHWLYSASSTPSINLLMKSEVWVEALLEYLPTYTQLQDWFWKTTMYWVAHQLWWRSHCMKNIGERAHFMKTDSPNTTSHLWNRNVIALILRRK